MSLVSERRAASRRIWSSVSATVLVMVVAGVLRYGQAPFGRPDGVTRIVVAPESTSSVAAESSRTLRVCADPNNLPFSNAKSDGFENKIAELVARTLGREIEYVWQPQRRGFLRTTLHAGLCDVVIGMPASSDAALMTVPYYRSTYVFVSRRDRGLNIRSFDDPRLLRLRIGIQVTGDDYDNPPAAQALAARHVVHVIGFPVYGDYLHGNPQAAPIAGLETGSVDVAVVWGPVAGYFAEGVTVPLRVAVATPLRESTPLAFDIAMAVRHDDRPLADALNGVIGGRANEIRRILLAYRIPVLPLALAGVRAPEGL